MNWNLNHAHGEWIKFPGYLVMRACNPSVFVVTVLLILLESPGYQSVLFIETNITADYLADMTNFSAKSQVECAWYCHRKMNGNACTSFTLNKSANLCTCGKKRFAPVQETNSKTNLHIASKCPKLKTGEKEK